MRHAILVNHGEMMRRQAGTSIFTQVRFTTSLTSQACMMSSTDPPKQRSITNQASESWHSKKIWIRKTEDMDNT